MATGEILGLHHIKVPVTKAADKEILAARGFISRLKMI